MDIDDKLVRDYQETANYFRNLADSRLKLLALVPVVAGAAIALFSKDPFLPVILPLSLLGFFVTLGILFYDQRNTEIYDNLLRRLKALEAALEFPSFISSRHRFGGAFLDRPPREKLLFGCIRMWHDRGLAIIYSAALGSWSYLFFYAVLSASLPGRAVVSLIFSTFGALCVSASLIFGLRNFGPAIESENEAIIDDALARVAELRRAKTERSRDV